MRIKLLSTIASILFMSVAFSSCLKSEEQVIELSSDARVHAFGLSAILNKEYTFSIDHLNRRIYNADSLPVQSDTLLDRILIDTFSVTGWVTTGSPVDSALVLNDSLDLRKAINAGNEGLEFTVHAADGVTSRKYYLDIRVHLQHPDSLQWDSEVQSLPAVDSEAKSVILKNEEEKLFIYTSSTTAFQKNPLASKEPWQEITAINLPADVRLNTLFSRFGKLYTVTAGGKVWHSADGVQWEENTGLSGNVKALFPSLDGMLTAVVETESGYIFNTTTDGVLWTADEAAATTAVPETFPLQQLSTAAYVMDNGLKAAIVTGSPRNNSEKQTLMWFTSDGKNWNEMSVTDYDAYIPRMERPFLMSYGKQFYCFGDKLTQFYASKTGLAWRAPVNKFLMPEALRKGTELDYSACVDGNAYIWLVLGGKGEALQIYRGRLNKLGFRN